MVKDSDRLYSSARSYLGDVANAVLEQDSAFGLGPAYAALWLADSCSGRVEVWGLDFGDTCQLGSLDFLSNVRCGLS